MMNMTKNNVFLAVVELIEAKYSDIIALSLKVAIISETQTPQDVAGRSYG